MDSLVRDIVYTLRQLRKAPSFALTTVLTLTMAIAANVVVFGVVHSMHRPLPAQHPEQLVQVQGKDAMDITVSYPNFADARERNSTFSDMAIYQIARLGLVASDGKAQPVWAFAASGNYFDLLGMQPAAGRFFHLSDDTKINGGQVAVISYNCWQTRFGGDPQISGKNVLINKLPYTVVGVTPKSFNGTEKFLLPEVWVPYHDLPQIQGHKDLGGRGDFNSWAIGQLKPGVTRAQADADLARVSAQLGAQYPGEDSKLIMRTSDVGFLGDGLGKPASAFFLGVMLLAMLVLLAACTNLGGLFAARTADRAKELGIRIAIGSTRGTIVRQLLTESVTISLIGGAIAAVVSATFLHLLSQWHPAHLEIPMQLFTEPDAWVYVAALGFAMMTGLIFGLIPVRQIWKTDPNETLKAAGSTGHKEHRFAVRHVLLAVQIALCCLLVTSAAVAARGLQRTFLMPLGFQPDHMTLAALDPHLGGYDPKDVPAVQQKLLHAVQAIPGVSAAAFSNTTPLSMNTSNTPVFAPGTTDFKNANAKFYAQEFDVSPNFFQTIGTRLLFGREFTEHDNADAPRVTVINATFARKLFGTVDAVGKSYPGWGQEPITVVGVVEDGKYNSLSEDPTTAFFQPIAQNPRTDTVLLVRSDRSATEILPAIHQAILSVDGGIPVFTLDTWTDALSLVTLPARAATVALGVLGLLAMMLAITGIFGQANYTVSRRIRELGIRVALGAQNRQVLRAALGRIAVLLAVGSFAGLLLGIGASKLLASIVYQATAADPFVILTAALAMGMLGMLSALIPARRAMRVDPAVLLRDQ